MTEHQAAKAATEAKPRHIDIAMIDGGVLPACVVPPPPGRGPGLLLLGGRALDASLQAWAQRYAEEGYAVLAPDLSRHFAAEGNSEAARRAALGDIATARTALAPYLEAAARTGALGLGRGAVLAGRLAAMGAVDTLVVFGTAALAKETALWGRISCPVALHIAGPEAEVVEAAAAIRAAVSGNTRFRVHECFGNKKHFADPLSTDYDHPAATVARSRSLLALREIGPHYDYSGLFRQHNIYEFVTHDADATMDTMVAQPYVNHVPTLTGGYGHDLLKRFYKYHFIPNLPTDRNSILIGETVGPDCVIVELVNTFTHNAEIEYLLPGIPPSGKVLRVPVIIVAKFKGGKLYHEHIYWDQSTLLVQLGLLDPTGLPVAGAEQAAKMLDQTQPSNHLMASWPESDGKPI